MQFNLAIIYKGYYFIITVIFFKKSLNYTYYFHIKRVAIISQGDIAIFLCKLESHVNKDFYV